jgi:hypothetical protein
MKEIDIDTLPSEFISFLNYEDNDGEDDGLNTLRAINLDFYNGALFGNEVKGRSQYRTRDVQTVVDYMVENVLELFVSGNNAVEFEHDNANMAKQATALITRDFMRKQDGYRILHDWLKSGLIEKTSIIKTNLHVPQYKTETEIMGLEDIAALEQSGIDILAANQIDEVQFEVSYKRKIKGVSFSDEVCANEEVSVNRDARNIDSAAYVRFESEKSLSDLRKMGFEFEDTDLQTGKMDREQLSRARDGRAQTTQSHYRSGANRIVVLMEEHVCFDLDGDGYSERLIVHRVGQKILSVQEIECVMFEEWCPYPMPNRRVGNSLADKAIDIQLLRSTLARQAIDNLFQSNIPRVLVNEDSMGDSTMSDILDMRVGAPIRYKGDTAPAGFKVPFVAGEAFNAMQLFNDELESRSGVTKANQGLNRDVLNKTATGAAMQMSQGRIKEMFLARNFAEAFSRLMRKKYKLYREYGEPVEMMIDDEMVTIDPSQWPDEMETSILVGMGSGRKEDRVQNLTQLATFQAEALQAGLPIVTPENIYKTGVALVENMALGNPKDYWTAPPEEQEKQEKPDPEMAKVEADIAMKQQAAAADNEIAQIRLQNERDAASLKLEIMREDAKAKRELDRDQADFEADQARLNAEREFELARMKIGLGQMADIEMNDLPDNRDGGAVNE